VYTGCLCLRAGAERGRAVCANRVDRRVGTDDSMAAGFKTVIEKRFPCYSVPVSCTAIASRLITIAQWARSEQSNGRR